MGTTSERAPRWSRSDYFSPLKHKKSRLGEAEVMGREEYGELEVDAKVEMIRYNSSQRQRWLATALVDIEPRLRRVIGYRHLPKLREALKRELKIETKTSTVSKKKVA